MPLEGGAAKYYNLYGSGAMPEDWGQITQDLRQYQIGESDLGQPIYDFEGSQYNQGMTGQYGLAPWEQMDPARKWAQKGVYQQYVSPQDAAKYPGLSQAQLQQTQPQQTQAQQMPQMASAQGGAPSPFLPPANAGQPPGLLGGAGSSGGMLGGASGGSQGVGGVGFNPFKMNSFFKNYWGK
jgi:hypothetical protein